MKSKQRQQASKRERRIQDKKQWSTRTETVEEKFKRLEGGGQISDNPRRPRQSGFLSLGAGEVLALVNR
jgi:hypothetical protein